MAPNDSAIPIEEVTEDSSDFVNRVTIFRLKASQSGTSGIFIDGYNEVYSSEDQDDAPWKFTVYFKQNDIDKPKWMFLFAHLTFDFEGERQNLLPQVGTSGYIILVNYENSTYACTGGGGHFRIQGNLATEPRFGISVAKKILKKDELKSLSQKDATSFVHSLERAFRTNYQPKNDTDNLHRILTGLRGALSKSREEERREIGTSLKASDSLTVTGKKNLGEVFAFIAKIHQIYSGQLDPENDDLDVPELAWINPKKQSTLIEALEQQLRSDLIALHQSAQNLCELFIDNIDVGFLPDIVDKYELHLGRDRHDCGNEYFSVLRKMGEILSTSRDPSQDLKRFRITIHSSENNLHFQKIALELLCGDITHQNESYFLNAGRWYCANTGFKEILDREINEIAFISPEEFDLQAWQGTEHEEDFNARHSSDTSAVLDQKFVRIPQERGPIEFCDILHKNNQTFNLIHVKNESGAALRALFAQAYVATKLYNDEQQFREKVTSANIDRSSQLTVQQTRLLADLKSAKKRDVRVVMAIYDPDPAHSPRSSGIQTENTQILFGTLSLFAKVDLLQRCQSLRSMGYDVALTRIKPYPVRN